MVSGQLHEPATKFLVKDGNGFH